MFTEDNNLRGSMHGRGGKTGVKAAPNIFDNYDVKYLHRRLTAAGLNMLESLRELTYSYAAKQGNPEAWTVLWKHTLPSIAYYNQYIQRSVAKEVTDMVPDIEKALHSTFQLYCKHYFGKDVHGNINIIRGTMPPFSEFYHCFLTRLCADPTTVRLQVFDDHTLLSKTVKNAILDALRDSSVDRVHILETITEAQFRERMRGKKDSSRERSREREEDDRSRVREEDDESRTKTWRPPTPPTSPSTKRYEDSDDDRTYEPSRTETAPIAEPPPATPSKTKRASFTLNDPTIIPLAPLPPPSRPAESAPEPSAVSMHGTEWLKRLETMKSAKPHSGELGPDDSASSVNSLGKQAQLFDPTKQTRRINMTFESSSTPSKGQGTKASFSEKMSLL